MSVSALGECVRYVSVVEGVGDGELHHPPVPPKMSVAFLLQCRCVVVQRPIARVGVYTRMLQWGQRNLD